MLIKITTKIPFAIKSDFYCAGYIVVPFHNSTNLNIIS